MLEYAEHEFSLSKTDQNGVTTREHLEMVERQTGKTPQGLEGTQFPTLVSHIWSAFVALSRSRSVGFSGPNPISYQDIKAWLELTNQTLSSRDVESIMKLDIIFLRNRNG